MTPNTTNIVKKESTGSDKQLEKLGQSIFH